MGEDLYAVLNISRDADFADIRSAYRRAALAVHPDKGGCAEDFLLVAKAFEVLSHDASRAAYDRRFRRASRRSRRAPCSTPDRIGRFGSCCASSATQVSVKVPR